MADFITVNTDYSDQPIRVSIEHIMFYHTVKDHPEKTTIHLVNGKSLTLELSLEQLDNMLTYGKPDKPKGGVRVV